MTGWVEKVSSFRIFYASNSPPFVKEQKLDPHIPRTDRAKPIF
jgi:hypothetical protein